MTRNNGSDTFKKYENISDLKVAKRLAQDLYSTGNYEGIKIMFENKIVHLFGEDN